MGQAQSLGRQQNVWVAATDRHQVLGVSQRSSRRTCVTRIKAPMWPGIYRRIWLFFAGLFRRRDNARWRVALAAIPAIDQVVACKNGKRQGLCSRCCGAQVAASNKQAKLLSLGASGKRLFYACDARNDGGISSVMARTINHHRGGIRRDAVAMPVMVVAPGAPGKQG